eukprot:363818-Chlamydomonas_euryale.AAC.8
MFLGHTVLCVGTAHSVTNLDRLSQPGAPHPLGCVAVLLRSDGRMAAKGLQVERPDQSHSTPPASSQSLPPQRPAGVLLRSCVCAAPLTGPRRQRACSCRLPDKPRVVASDMRIQREAAALAAVQL